MAVELDALPPATLEAFVRDAIESELDLSQIGADREREQAERGSLEDIQGRVVEFVLGQ